MSTRYLAEFAPAALISLELAQKQAAHLKYSQSTLFSQALDAHWVTSLASQPERAENLEAFVSRFNRLQDHIGVKLLPTFALLVGEQTKTVLDTLAFSEKTGLLANADAFIAARRVRNALVYEYMIDPALFLENLLVAKEACHLLYDVIDRAQSLLLTLGLTEN